MDVNVIQEFMDNLSRAMLAKGLRNPDAQFHIQAHVAPCVFMRWGEYGDPDHRVEVIRDPDAAQCITDAFTVIESLPSAEEAKRQQFMSSLAKVIDLGRENGIEVDFINPLTETMKRLSENAITYQPKTDLPEVKWSGTKTDAEIAMEPNSILDELTYQPTANQDFDDGNITP